MISVTRRPEAIRIDPKIALAYNNRGNAYSDNGDNDRAISDYTEAIRIDSLYVAAYTNRGLAFERLEKIERARANFNAALGMPQKFDNGKWAHDTARKRLVFMSRYGIRKMRITKEPIPWDSESRPARNP